jgi:hypothetical protein
MPRVPYEMVDVILGKRMRFALGATDSSAFGISEELATLIATKAECTVCNIPVQTISDHVGCDTQPRRRHIQINFTHEEMIAFFDLLGRESARRKAFKRRLQLATSIKRHTPSQLTVLLELQEQRCYFCFRLLHNPRGDFVGQRDHFLALIAGGTDEIQNIVYACPMCNALKGAADGQKFRTERLRAAQGGAKAGLRRIHSAVKRGEF